MTNEIRKTYVKFQISTQKTSYFPGKQKSFK